MRTRPATLREALGGDALLNTTAFQQEEAQQAIEVHHAEADAPIVESGGDIGTPIRVSATDTSGFEFFVDGIEVSSVAAWVLGLPVRVGHVAAAAVGRNDREMNDFVSERLETVILVPEAIPAERKQQIKELEGVEDRKVWIVEAKGEGDALPRDWHSVLCEAVSKRRDELERDVIVDATSRNAEAWLVVDGGIAKHRTNLSAGSVVGLVKSHRHYYFTPETVAACVFPLPEGHRTPVFEAALSANTQPTYSWYLRLRASDAGPPWFGLVRVEMCERDTAVHHVDDVSAWLLAERAPISLPDARYDRLIYPIRFIEQYLRSRQPSAWQLRALIGCA